MIFKENNITVNIVLRYVKCYLFEQMIAEQLKELQNWNQWAEELERDVGKDGQMT